MIDEQDAKVLKQLGLPPDTPMVEATFSRPYSIRWFRMVKAHESFLLAIIKYCKSGEYTPQGWGKIKRTYNNLERALETFRHTPAVGGELQIIDIFFQRNVPRFRANWKAIKDEAESGEEIKLKMSALALTDEDYKDF